MHEISHPAFDIYIEAFVAELIQNTSLDLRPDQVFVNHQGNKQRRARKDILKVNLEENWENGTIEKLSIDTSREGIYDLLPEMLFLNPNFEEEEKDTEKARLIQSQIESARKFFHPIEQAIFQLRLLISLREREICNSFPQNWIMKLWGLQAWASLLTKSQSETLMFFLTHIHEIRDHPQKLTPVLKSLLRKQVNVLVSPSGKHTIPEEDIMLLNKQNLGDDTIIGESFQDGIPRLEIQISGIEPGELGLFFPGGTLRELLEKVIYPFGLSLEWEVSTELFCVEETSAFYLTKQHESILGYTTNL